MKLPGLKPLIEIGRNRGGELRFAALLCLAGSLGLSAVLFTNIFFGRPDSLLRYVPGQAAIYLHANRDPGPGASWSIRELAQPENVEADEIARFALVNGDGSLSWGALFRWRAWHEPTPDARELLTLADATAIDERTFLVGADKVAAAVLAAWGNRTALADSRDASRALAAVRGLADLQAYVDPEQLPRDLRSAGPYLLQDLKAFALAAAESEGRIRLVIMPAASIPKKAAWMGSSADIRAISAPRPQLPAGADVAVYGMNPGVDLHDILFGGIDSLVSAAPFTDPTFARPAKAELDSLLHQFDAIAIYRADKAPAGFYARCSSCTVDEITDRIGAYANAAVPERRQIALPDKDTLTELVYGDHTVRWEELGGSGIKALYISGDRVELYVDALKQGPDQRHTVVLTNRPALLNPETTEHPITDEPCSLNGLHQAVVRSEIAGNMLKMIFNGRDFGLNQLKTLLSPKLSQAS